MKKTYKQAEIFLLKTMAIKYPEIPRSTLLRWAMNHHLELEQEGLFNSADYENEEARAIAMFPEMPLLPLQMISCKFYKSCSDKKGENHEKRIKELETVVEESEDKVFISVMSAPQWWED